MTSAKTETPTHFADTLWISWECHRRTRQLAGALGVPLVELTSHASSASRYAILGWRTARTISSRRPQVLIVQNPSIMLAALASALKVFYGYRLIVDRHTNFMINKPDSVLKRVFGLISRYTLRSADLTIVTNEPLADLVKTAGGVPFVLPDRIPEWECHRKSGLAEQGLRSVCFVCTYAFDEPYENVFRAATALPEDVRVFVTGRLPKSGFAPSVQRIVDRTPQLVVTGYLNDEDYESLISSSVVVMDLTTLDHCLVCGAYEAVAAGKPLILSDKTVNREVFGECAIFVDNDDPRSIQDAILSALSQREELDRKVASFRISYSERWEKRLSLLKTWLMRGGAQELACLRSEEDRVKP